MKLVVFLPLLAGSIALAIYLKVREERTAARLRPTDADVLSALKAAGSDLSQPHAMEFFLHFPSRDAALSAVAAVEADGFATNVGPGQGSRYHILLATKEMVPNEVELMRIRQHFSALASSAGGTYDGWGSSVVRAHDA